MALAVAEPETVAEFTVWIVAEREAVTKFAVGSLQSLRRSENSRYGGHRTRDCRGIHGMVIAEPETFHKCHDGVLETLHKPHTAPIKKTHRA